MAQLKDLIVRSEIDNELLVFGRGQIDFFQLELVMEHLRNVSKLKVHTFGNGLGRVSTVKDTIGDNFGN
jgi:hypothetical protein